MSVTDRDNLIGAAFMTLSMAGFALNDTLMKSFSGDLPLMQVIFLRGIFACLFVGALAAATGQLKPKPVGRDTRLLIYRCLGEAGATVFFLTALFNMNLADATAIMQILPLAITMAAAVFLGEAVGIRRTIAAAVGFVGVMIIIRPGGEEFTIYSLFCLTAVIALVFRDLTTRMMSGGLPTLFISLLTAFSAMLTGAIGTLLTGWQPVTLSQVALMAGCACFLLMGYIFGVLCMRRGEVSFTSPFRYSILLWAIFLGWLIFDERPDGWMMLGSAIVVGAGLFTLRREALLKS